MDTPNYYDILSITNHPNLSFEEIQVAYDKALNKYNILADPARFRDSNDPARRRAQAQLNQVEIAFQVLSDESRKREYDTLLESARVSDFQLQRQSSQVQDSNRGPSPSHEGNQTSIEFDHGDTLSKVVMGVGAVATLATVVFLRNDQITKKLTTGKQITQVWKYVGGVSGAALGHIVANLPGMALGAIAGSQLGAMRDAESLSPTKGAKVLKTVIPQFKNK